MSTETKFETWAIVELLGHQKIAGHISEHPLAGTNMLRVDVPETKSNPAFTRFIGGAAIYAINPCTEEIARYKAEDLGVKPVDAWDVSKYVAKQEQLKLEAASTQEISDEDLDDIFR